MRSRLKQGLKEIKKVEAIEVTETDPVRQAVQQAIDENPVILFMKGTPEQPSCGFSARTVAALQAVGRQFAAVDVLPDPRIRQELSAISNWPTIPQLFIDGDLVGGCDIVLELYESGQLNQLLGVDQAEGKAEDLQAPDKGPYRSPLLQIDDAADQ